MRLLFLAALPVACLVAAAHGAPGSDGAAAVAIGDAYPFYHTSDQLESALQELDGKCRGATFRREREGEAALPVLEVNSTGVEKTRVMLVFGEHARELISAESALALAKSLCGPSEEATTAREATSYLVVANANPLGRRHAEAGSFCARANEHGVDLNRNYGSHWRKQAQGDMTAGIAAKDGGSFRQWNSGPEAFSEPETRIVRRLLGRFRPSAYVSVHSGTEALLAPWAWTRESSGNSSAIKRMNEVLTAVGQRYCRECRIGETAEEVGYLAGGVSSDYAFSAGTPFSFTWEIFAGKAARATDAIDDELYDAKKEAAKRRVSGGNSGDSARGKHGDDSAEGTLKNAGHEAVRRKNVGLFGRRGRIKWDVHWLFKRLKRLRRDAVAADPHGDDAPATCFTKFNPVSRDDYAATLRRWTSAFLDLPTLVRLQG